jgi:hypothetical protein
MHRTIGDARAFVNFFKWRKASIRNLAALSARVLREFALGRGRRESRVPDRTRSPVRKIKKHTSVVTTGSTGSIRLSPREWF